MVRLVFKHASGIIPNALVLRNGVQPQLAVFLIYPQPRNKQFCFLYTISDRNRRHYRKFDTQTCRYVESGISATNVSRLYVVWREMLSKHIRLVFHHSNGIRQTFAICALPVINQIEVLLDFLKETNSKSRADSKIPYSVYLLFGTMWDNTNSAALT